MNAHVPPPKLTLSSPKIVTSFPVIEVTPAFAQELLTLNTSNRNLRPRDIEAHAKLMRAGEWRPGVGQPITLSTDMVLLDGQHRLHAVVKSGVTVHMCFNDAGDPSDRRYMDNGAGRTVSDELKMLGYSYSNGLAGAHRQLVIVATQGQRTPKMTSSDTIAFLKLHPLLVDSVAATHQISWISPSQMGAIHYLGAVIQKKPALADAFIDVFKSGIPNYRNDPASVLREKLIKLRGTVKSISPLVTLFTALHAWDQFKNGKTTSSKMQWHDEFNLACWKEVNLSKAP